MALDKDRLLAVLRNSTQNPIAVERVILAIEAGEFEEAAVAKSAPVVEKAVVSDAKVETRGAAE